MKPYFFLNHNKFLSNLCFILCIKERKLFEQKPIKLIQLNVKTFERLKEHGRYYNHDEEGNVSSVDELITRLINFYEENYLNLVNNINKENNDFELK